MMYFVFGVCICICQFVYICELIGDYCYQVLMGDMNIYVVDFLENLFLCDFGLMVLQVEVMFFSWWLQCNFDYILFSFDFVFEWVDVFDQLIFDYLLVLVEICLLDNLCDKVLVVCGDVGSLL